MNSKIKNNAEMIRFLGELKSRVIYALLFLSVIFAAFTFYANQLYSFLAKPLLHYLPSGHLIATQIVSPFFVPFKLAFVAALLVSMPFFLYQLWTFISPALYGHEKKLIWPFLLCSVILFYTGLMFAYLVIFPMLFNFLANTAPQGVQLSPDINEYLDFTTKLLLVFGCLFEIPMAMVLLVSTNLVTRQKFLAMRGYAIVTAFILGMLLAPPDVLSQTILAVPIWLLYEAGLILCIFVSKAKREQKNS